MWVSAGSVVAWVCVGSVVVLVGVVWPWVCGLVLADVRGCDGGQPFSFAPMGEEEGEVWLITTAATTYY